jgi:hypothetical protein
MRTNIFAKRPTKRPTRMSAEEKSVDFIEEFLGESGFGAP